MRLAVFVLGIAAGVLCMAQEAPQRTAPSDIRVEARPATTLLVRAGRGPFSGHAIEFARLRDFASERSIPMRDVVGVYPDDPDVVGIEKLSWQIGFTIDPARGESTKGLDSPFQVVDLPAGDAAVIDSTLGHSHVEGIRLLAWLPYSGYVQVGPTRIEYSRWTADPSAPVRIVVPVRKRKFMAAGSGLGDTAAALDAIRSLRTEDESASRAMDWKRLRAIVSDSAVMLAPGDRVRIGKKDIDALFAERAGAEGQFEITSYRLALEAPIVDGRLAVEHGEVLGEGRRKADGAAFSHRFRVLRVLRFEPDGRWRVLASMWAPVTEEPVLR